MGKVWLEIRSGRHPGFEEGEFDGALQPYPAMSNALQCGRSLRNTWSSDHNWVVIVLATPNRKHIVQSRCIGISVHERKLLL